MYTNTCLLEPESKRLNSYEKITGGRGSAPDTDGGLHDALQTPSWTLDGLRMWRSHPMTRALSTHPGCRAQIMVTLVCTWSVILILTEVLKLKEFLRSPAVMYIVKVVISLIQCIILSEVITAKQLDGSIIWNAHYTVLGLKGWLVWQTVRATDRPTDHPARCDTA